MDDYETWNEGGVVPTLNLGDNTGDTRATVLIYVEPIGTLQARDYKGEGSTVRRLTPMECERLQGFPDS